MRKLLLCGLALSLLAAAPTLAGRAGEVRTEAFRLLNEGVAAYKRGEYATAVDRLDRSAGMALNNFRAHYYLGLALSGDRRYEKAIEALDIALELDPNHLQAHVARGDAYLKLGDLDEARASYFLSLKLRPEYPPGLDGLARVYAAQAEIHEAKQHFLRSIRQDRGFAAAYTHLGDLYLSENEYEEAVMLLEEAISVRPDFAEGLNRLALAYGRLGLHNEAVAAIRKAMELQPSAASHPAALGRVQLDEGFVGAAEGWYVRALELDPALPQARMGLAEVARRRGDYELALGQIATALADPRLDALNQRMLEQEQERLETERGVVQALRQRLEAGEADEDDYVELAALAAGRGQWERAVELQRMAGDGADRRERLAYLLFRSGRYRAAEEIYRELAATTPRADLEVNTGVAEALLGDDRAAVEAYDRALGLEPAHPDALLYRGNSLLRLNLREDAVASYLSYLDVRKTGEAAERVRRILRQVAPDKLPPSDLQLDATPPTPPAETAGARGSRP